MSTTHRIQTWVTTGTGRQAPSEISVEVQDGNIVGDSSGSAAGSAIQVRSEAAALSALDLVYISGWNETEGMFLVTKADANAAGKQAQFIVRSAIAQNTNGVAYTAARSSATLNTNGTTVGDAIYLSETAGGWTTSAPTSATSSVQIVGRVAVVSATVGVIEFDLRDFPTINTNDIQAKAVTLAKMDDLADGKILMGDGTNRPAAVTPSGDVTITNAGVTAIGATKVTNAMLASGAGVGALLTAGLGGSASYLKTQNATADLLAANGTKDRACLVVVVVDETFADAGGNQPTFTIGEEATLNKFFDTAAFTNKTAGTVLVAAGTNLATKKVQVTGVQAVGAGTGGITVTVLAIPTT